MAAKISKGKKRIDKKIRIPIPIKPGKPHTTKKGKKGYNRKKEKEKERDLLKDELY
jgi:hypothetical protein